MLTKISRKIGFTLTEIRVILFLLIIFLLGLSLKYFLTDDHKSRILAADYSLQDSLFFYSDNSDSNISKLSNKVVDSKLEVLDFNNRDFQEKKSSNIAGEKSIELNTADINALISLPGIGEKTASAILEYKKNIGKFRNLNELMNVKGIGVSKFNKIKKYIYIDDK